MIYGIALIVTLVAWCAQAYTSLIQKENKLNPVMPLLYCIACLCFAYVSFTTNDFMWAVVDLVIAILALLIFIFVLKKK